jgi:glutamine synthetase
MPKIFAEYIWMDGKKPTAKLRSKTKIINQVKELSDIPAWGFDGSSTEQAEGHFSDCALKPVYYIPDPIRGEPNILVMCEVMNADGTPHITNTRHILAGLVEKYKDQEPWFGFEQEYTLYRKEWPVGWPKEGFPHPQGRYYCGVGSDEVYGRKLVEAHMRDCQKAGISICGINAEVMPAQWEFQIGVLPPLEAADQLWLARWILYRHGEDFEMYAKLDPKPMAGDWNGAGGPDARGFLRGGRPPDPRRAIHRAGIPHPAGVGPQLLRVRSRNGPSGPRQTAPLLPPRSRPDRR